MVFINGQAHVIRNRQTEQAKAAFQLRAQRRWCLTGNHFGVVPVSVASLFC